MKVQGGLVQIVQGWRPVTEADDDKRWTIESIEAGRAALFSKSGPGVPPLLFSVEE